MKPDVDDVTVIVVTYNSAHCIPALAKTLASLPHVTFVDNASADDTLATVRRLLPHATVISNERNRGFGAANNSGLLAATTSHALLLNPDCELAPEALRGLLQAAADFPEAAMIAPHLVNRSGDVELNYRWPSTRWESRGPGADGPCCVGFVCGATMLLNLAVMKDIGYFDEAFFLYYEDDDLCHRIFARGKEIVLVPQVEVAHFSRGSVRGPAPLRAEFIRGYHHAQSKLIFARKHIDASRARRLRVKTLTLALATLLPRLLLPAPRHVARLVGRICGLVQYRG